MVVGISEVFIVSDPSQIGGVIVGAIAVNVINDATIAGASVGVYMQAIFTGAKDLGDNAMNKMWASCVVNNIQVSILSAVLGDILLTADVPYVACRRRYAMASVVHQVIR